MANMRQDTAGLRRRAAGASSEDLPQGCTTEDDTGVSDDHREDAPPAKNNSTEGGDKLLARAWLRKMTIRAVAGCTMMSLFAGVIYLGHAYVCLLVFFLQCFIFSELVGVRKKLAAERKLPLFRFLQWAWFFVASFFTWSANVCEFLERSPAADISTRWSAISHFVIDKNMLISFWLYTGLLIISVLSLRKPMYKYQITQYTWTIVTICLVVFQTQAVFQIIYAGLFWFVLPSSLVICNDIMAYYCGQFLGRKFIRRPFLPELSPNKTWEGFLGSAFFTMLFAFWFSKKLSGYQWMTCVPEQISFGITDLKCTPSLMYQPRPLATLIDEAAPTWLVEVLAVVMKFMPSVVRALDSLGLCTAQFHALCLGFFASFAAPFGGFLSSAIKRAYGIKDFNNLIPGHGGLMDRFDCQFVMFLCTFVHHRTFCYMPVTVDALVASALQLSAVDQKELLQRLQNRVMNGSL